MRHRKRAPLASRGIIVARVCTRARIRVYRCSSDVNDEKMVFRRFIYVSHLVLPIPFSSTSPVVDTSRRLHDTEV